MFINNLYGCVYGIMTDGTNIIHVLFEDDFNGLITTFEYVPNINIGCGCATLDEGCYYKELNKEFFLVSSQYREERKELLYMVQNFIEALNSILKDFLILTGSTLSYKGKEKINYKVIF